MRGIAAAIVLFHHFTHMYYPDVLTGTDLRSVLVYPLIAGHESVMFFFLLSGFVLSLPYIRGKSQPYFIFIRRRILRIYGPYLGALALALAGCAMWHNRLRTTGWAAGTWFEPVTLSSVGQHVLFIGNYDYSRYNTAFWSLVYEMRISIVFPFLFFAAGKLGTKYTVPAIGICTFIGVRASESKFFVTFEYAGIFLLGVLLAKNIARLKALYDRMSASQRIVLALVSFLFYVGGRRIAATGPLWHLGDMPVVLGAAGFLIIGLHSAMARGVLNSKLPAFLGRISYSLYLIHGTVLFAMASVLRHKISPPAFFLFYVPLAVLLSWGFYKTVEEPFMRLSRSVGSRKKASSAVPAPI